MPTGLGSRELMTTLGGSLEMGGSVPELFLEGMHRTLLTLNAWHSIAWGPSKAQERLNAGDDSGHTSEIRSCCE